MIAAIFAGGAVGAITRAAVTALVPVEAGSWPWPIFAINIGGTLALGFFATRMQERLAPTTYQRPLIGTGFCGALTTFSTMQVELVRLVDRDQLAIAFSYAGVSALAGLAGMVAATAATRRARLR